MSIRISVLVDDRSAGGINAEHGLALWLETADERILFDTGQGDVLEENARRMGIDLRTVDRIVLSHGHYDHGNGLGTVLKTTARAHVYAHDQVGIARYSIAAGLCRRVGLSPESAQGLKSLPKKRLHYCSAPLRLSPRVGLTGPIPRLSSFEDLGGCFYLDEEARIPDKLTDDQALWIDTPKGAIVLVGCAHAGLINTLNYVRELSQGAELYAVIGGFHLHNAPTSRLLETVAALKKIGPGLVVPLHCSGEKAVAAFQDSLAERCIPGRAGMVLDL